MIAATHLTTHGLVILALFLIAIVISVIVWFINNVRKRSVELDWYTVARVLVYLALVLWHFGW